MRWGPNGFGRPQSMYWRKKDGTQIYIPDMDDNHLLNCKKLLEKKFTEQKIANWPIWKSLIEEIKRRGLSNGPEWDS